MHLQTALLTLYTEKYNPESIQPWIENIFNLLLAAILSKQHLNIQETGISSLVGLLEFGMDWILCQTQFLMTLHIEHPRQDFIHLGHVNTLLEMLSMNEETSIQLAALQILTALLINGWQIIYPTTHFH